MCEPDLRGYREPVAPCTHTHTLVRCQASKRNRHTATFCLSMATPNRQYRPRALAWIGLGGSSGSSLRFTCCRGAGRAPAPPSTPRRT